MGYSFVSYAHKDKRAVLKELKKREREGQELWYDESIEAGADWAETLASRLAGAESILYFESSASKKSDNCKREIAYAKEHGISIEVVNLGGSSGKVAALVFALLAVAALVYYVGFKYVPNVVGYRTAPAVEKLEEYGYKGNVKYEYSDEFPLGVISKQNIHEKAFPLLPVVITQSLGSEDSLTTVPDTVGSQVSDGVRMLVEAGLKKFTIGGTSKGNSDFGIITYQSAPAGYKVSTDSNVALSVATYGTPVTFSYDGLNITVPVSTDSAVEVDFEKKTVKTIADYSGRVLSDAEYITIDANHEWGILDQTYNKPVVITGGDGGTVYFRNCTFNSDIIIQSDWEEIVVGIEGSCKVNGELVIINNIMESDIDTTLPKFLIEANLPVNVERGSGTCFVFGKNSMSFNGEKYSMNTAEDYIDPFEGMSSIVPIKDSETKPTMYMVSQTMENGEPKVSQLASIIKRPDER